MRPTHTHASTVYLHKYKGDGACNDNTDTLMISIMGKSAHFMLNKLVINIGDIEMLLGWCDFYAIHSTEGMV